MGKEFSEKTALQESKEYQLKLDIGAVLQDRHRDRGDAALFHAAATVIRQAVANIARDGESEVVVRDNAWHRDALRYDTAEGRLKAHDLTLAIEATDERTKLKCKLHSFIQELLFAEPDRAIVYPDIRAAGAYKKHDAKLKREQDIHLDNLKFCASGSLFVKGRQTEVRDSAFFERYFPRLDAVLPVSVPLRPVSHWNETVYDDMRTRWKHVDLDSWMLVNRWDVRSGELLESELSFKLVKPLDAPWDLRLLKEAGALYHALQGTGLFLELPPIFRFFDPVSAIDIMKAPAQA